MSTIGHPVKVRIEEQLWTVSAGETRSTQTPPSWLARTATKHKSSHTKLGAFIYVYNNNTYIGIFMAIYEVLGCERGKNGQDNCPD